MTTTVNYSWALPTVGASVNTWGTLVNNILTDIDAKMFARTGGTISGNVSVTGQVTTTDNVGVGVTPSAWGTGASQRAIQLPATAIYSYSDSRGEFLTNSYFNGTNYIYRVNYAALKYVQDVSSGAHSWYTAPSGTAGNTITFNQAMTLDASGNLGLGVTPSAWGSAYKAIQTYGAALSGGTPLPTFCGVFANCYGASGSIKYTATGEASLYQQYLGAHTWYTAPSGTAGNPISFTQAMTLDASGNLLVGDTNIAMTDANSVVIRAPLGQIYCKHLTGAGSGTYYAAFGYAGSTIGSITQNGTTGVLYNTSSDQRLKENIVDAPAASDLIDAIQVRSFDWKSDGSHQRYGMVAQELFEVAPEAVHAPADPDEMMAVDYSKLVPMLVKEIQSLRARVAQLEG